MTLKVGINGFGRIGRMALRSIIEQNRKDLEVVAINNKGSAEISGFLLANDTIHGKLKSKINHSEKAINIDGKKINMIHETEISKIDWKKYKVNVVLECTGKFNTKENLHNILILVQTKLLFRLLVKVQKILFLELMKKI